MRKRIANKEGNPVTGVVILGKQEAMEFVSVSPIYFQFIFNLREFLPSFLGKYMNSMRQ